ncbi:MAG: hypothetical protein GOV15_01150, partial [Candidatus Diapherotrites archaeon]|nr:hypothetical protein [Candidatus Diapherotrites archaeon]
YMVDRFLPPNLDKIAFEEAQRDDVSIRKFAKLGLQSLVIERKRNEEDTDWAETEEEFDQRRDEEYAKINNSKIGAAFKNAIATDYLPEGYDLSFGSMLFLSSAQARRVRFLSREVVDEIDDAKLKERIKDLIPEPRGPELTRELTREEEPEPEEPEPEELETEEPEPSDEEDDSETTPVTVEQELLNNLNENGPFDLAGFLSFDPTDLANTYNSMEHIPDNNSWIPFLQHVSIEALLATPSAEAQADLSGQLEARLKAITVDDLNAVAGDT